MKIVDIQNGRPIPRIPSERFLSKRAAGTLGSSNSLVSCLVCPDEPCRVFERPSEVGIQEIRVCPVDAINALQPPLEEIVKPECFGCGVCALRCPIGAIDIINSRAIYRDRGGEGQAVTDLEDFLLKRSEMLALSDWAEDEVDQLATRLAERAQALKQSEFYPLVERLFRSLGFDTWLPARGDTSNRIDLLIMVDGLAIPVEIKSKTETPVINVKAIQQALENRIVLESREIRNTDSEFTSLVVGYDYAPERSDVSELVSDIQAAFGIRIGMVTVKALYVLLLRTCVDKSFNPRSTLLHLAGSLS